MPEGGWKDESQPSLNHQQQEPVSNHSRRVAGLLASYMSRYLTGLPLTTATQSQEWLGVGRSGSPLAIGSPGW